MTAISIREELQSTQSTKSKKKLSASRVTLNIMTRHDA